MEYIGEHSLPGILGYWLVCIAFASAAFGALAYFLTEQKDQSWREIARICFSIHIGAVFSIVATLFYIIYNQYFEYHYVWSHSSTSMPMRYIFSCFWEGQEGSFLLWMFWHAVLGIVLLKKAGKWEAPVLFVVCLVEAVLASMILGIYIGDIKIGSSPFILIRELPEYLNLPFTQMADYLSLPQFQDGRGLNPLLQNYWMTIHPPTLFLGFASTLIPFAYAIAALWRNEYRAWVKPAIGWTFFGIMVLGTGILMGGAWAYEALSFGGFWAWDPVENSSLVPWLVLVAAGHLMLLQKAKGKAAASSLIFSLLSFILILYSTFLTRSGVLGDSSVHAFVDLGLNGQLLIYLFLFIGLALGMYLYRLKSIPKAKDEDQLWSREFWMFIASLVFLLSGLQIIFTTSIPVINQVFGSNLAPPTEAINHYNGWQLPFAIILSLIMAFAQFLSYKKTEFKTFAKRLAVGALLAVACSAYFIWALNMDNKLYIALLLSTSFAVFSNLDYWLRIFKGKLVVAGPSIAHMGFALVILGSLVSAGHKKVISRNDSYIAEDFPVNEHILLEYQDSSIMGPYQVSWIGESKDQHNLYYDVAYSTRRADGSWEHAFTLQPFIQLNERMGNVAEPSTKHYWNRDIYTHITYAEIPKAEDDPNYTKEAELIFKSGEQDTVIYSKTFVILDSVSIKSDHSNGNNLSVLAHIKVLDMTGEAFFAEPVYSIYNNQVYYAEDTLSAGPQMKFRFDEIDANTKEFKIKAWTKRQDEDKFIVMKAIVFPYINILWIGCILMFIGTFIAVIQRIRKA